MAETQGWDAETLTVDMVFESSGTTSSIHQIQTRNLDADNPEAEPAVELASLAALS